MERELPVRQASLSQQIVGIIARRISGGNYSPGMQLPPESELAQEFGVSRATIRNALAKLETKGLVRRRQGAGTFVSQLSGITNPLNEVIDFFDLIANFGYEPGFQQVGASVEAADTETAEMLALDAGEELLSVAKVFTADGEPIIFVRNLIPRKVIRYELSAEELLRPGLTEPLFQFLEEACGQHVEYYIASVQITRASKFGHADLGIEINPDGPALLIDEVAHNRDEKPILRELEFYFDPRIRFDLVRRRSVLSGE